LYDTIKLIPALKQERPSLSKVYSQVLQQSLTRLDLAFQSFFRRVKENAEEAGFPRFKGYGRYDSLTYPQYGNGARLDGNTLILSKVGSVTIHLHRPVNGTIKTVTIIRGAGNKWYACLSVELEAQPQPPAHQTIGVDVGLEKFATLSNGETIANPRFLRRDEQDLKRAHRRLSKAQKGTPERAKRRKVVARIHERITNRRRDVAHQVSRKFVNRFDVIAFEDLTIARMLKNHCVAKSIADAAWSQLIQYTTYKAAEAGRVVVLVNPRGTSGRCSSCRIVVKKDLSTRVHQCPACGLTIDRDVNAALNILALGLQGIGIQSVEAAAL
jgi:putative transposase